MESVDTRDGGQNEDVKRRKVDAVREYHLLPENLWAKTEVKLKTKVEHLMR